MSWFDRLRGELDRSAAGRWFAGLGERDRLAVAALSAFLLVVLVYLAVWLPVSSFAEAADARYRKQEALLGWMKVTEQEARTSSSTSSGPRSGGSLLTLVANSASEAGVQLTRFQPEASGGVSVVLQNQDFNAVIRWLERLTVREQVVVRQLSIDDQDEPGLINARINLF